MIKLKRVTLTVLYHRPPVYTYPMYYLTSPNLTSTAPFPGPGYQNYIYSPTPFSPMQNPTTSQPSPYHDTPPITSPQGYQYPGGNE